MATKLSSVDVLIVGLGWTGGIVSAGLAPSGLKIVALERGGPRDTDPDFLDPQIHDELRYAARHELMQNVRKETLTFRNNSSQTALPMRQLGSFLPGQGVGGAGVHWNGATWRWLEWDHQARAKTVEKYGEKIIPTNMNLQDWPITYDDLEPYYDKFEKTCGTSGKAGNLNGQKIDGGNVFEAPRKSEYPNPPLIAAQSMVMFEKAARNLGYHPFPTPASNASRDYVNPDGVAFGQCHYCGFCERFGCEANAKASPHFTVIPLARRNPNFELRTNSIVLKVNLDSTGKKAVGATYLDARGREFEQPADLIILSAYALGNVHLLLHSGIGKPYSPSTGKGVVGRNYAYQCESGASAYFDEKTILNRFMGAGALGTTLDDFSGDDYDFAKAGYIGGGGISCSNYGARPIQSHPTPRGTPRWGSAWKKAVVDNYDHAASVSQSGGSDGLPGELPRPRSDIHRSLRAPVDADDVRLSGQRGKVDERPSRHLPDAGEGDGSQQGRAEHLRRAVFDRALSEFSQHWRRGLR
jgi:gluconate 2-dehydrogenase alpha chain